MVKNVRFLTLVYFGKCTTLLLPFLANQRRTILDDQYEYFGGGGYEAQGINFMTSKKE